MSNYSLDQIQRFRAEYQARCSKLRKFRLAWLPILPAFLFFMDGDIRPGISLFATGVILLFTFYLSRLLRQVGSCPACNKSIGTQLDLLNYCPGCGFQFRDSPQQPRKKVGVAVVAGILGTFALMSWLGDASTPFGTPSWYRKVAFSGDKSGIISATMAGDLGAVQKIIAEGANPNEKDKLGNTPLTEAIVMGYTQIAKYLLAHEADPNLEGAIFEVPLSIAIKKRNHDLVDSLLRRGAKIQGPAKFCNTPLHATVVMNDLPLAVRFFDLGATAKEQKGCAGTLLSVAAGNGSLDMMKLLIDHGAAVNGESCVPIVSAAATGELDALKLLLSKGAKIDLRCKNGMTALQAAAASGHIEIVRFLLANGADYRLTDSKSKTALNYATERHFDDIADLIQDFVQHGEPALHKPGVKERDLPLNQNPFAGKTAYCRTSFQSLANIWTFDKSGRSFKVESDYGGQAEWGKVNVTNRKLVLSDRMYDPLPLSYEKPSVELRYHPTSLGFTYVSHTLFYSCEWKRKDPLLAGIEKFFRK